MATWGRGLDMFRTVWKSPSNHRSVGCWRHSSIVGEAVCEGCGAHCCEHCWLEAPRGPLCIACALVFAGVRAPRRRTPPEALPADPAPLATMSWDESAALVDLARAA